MAKQKRIVCYAINGAGLGHVTRLLSVARWMRRYASLLDERPPEIFFLTSSDASDVLAEANFAAFKIPSKTVARKTELNKLEYKRLAKHFVWNTLGVFTPDLLVVDTFPSGSFDELFQVLDGPFRKSFIYRKVKPEYAARPTFRSAMRMYDSIVAPHAAKANAKNHFADVNSKVEFSGEVIQFEREDFFDRDDARAKLGVPTDHKLVYLSAGGGGDPNAETQIRTLVDVIGKLDKVHLLVGAGRLFRGQRISAPNISWYDGPAIGKYFAAIDAAVCAAGYNTFHELLFARVPTAFFAQEKIADDQAERIDSAVNLGACKRINDFNDHREIESAVEDLLNESMANELRNCCSEVIAENGASQCALGLLRPLYDNARLDWAQQILTPRLANRLERLSDSSAVIPQWLVTLAPQDRVRSFASNVKLDSLLGQLSDSASAEIKKVLARQDEMLDESTLESHLASLLDSIERFSEEQHSMVAGEVLKTIQATMKKQPLESEFANGNSSVRANNNWTRWICEILDGIKEVVASCSDSTQAHELLQLCRVFPKVVDAGARESLKLFQSYQSQRKSLGDQSHETNKALQLLKMKHSRVTKTILENSIEGITA